MESRRDKISSAIFFIVTFAIGCFTGIRIGVVSVELAAAKTCNEKIKEIRDDYLQMRDSYYLLKMHISERAKQKGIEL